MPKNPSDIIKIILAKRGIKTKKQTEEFFNPKDPERIDSDEAGIDKKELKKAVDRIGKAIKNKEKIIIYGDYDVDGICSAAILWESLYLLGADVLPYIPSRFTEGYGLRIDSIKKLKEDHPDARLIITVDNGITAYEKVDYARSLGLDVIITDHHQPAGIKPDAYSIIHTTSLSGSAVAWFLARALGSLLPDHLGLAALGTVADVLPLVGLNRGVVSYGLRLLQKTGRPGIVALASEAGIKQEEIDTFHIGFILGPRLNAAGRIEHAIDALRLLCTKNFERAEKLAMKLGRINRLRQEKTENMFNHIEENFASMWEEEPPKLLFVSDSSFSEGVIGIVAGRLVEKYARPAIVVAQQTRLSKGSARSVFGVNIIETIKKAGMQLFESAGGHPMAAGFTARTEFLPKISQTLKDIAEQEIPEEVLGRKLDFDCEIELEDVSPELYDLLCRLKPFGFGNREPVFLTKDVFIQEARLVGSRSDHLKLFLDNGLVAIGFRKGELLKDLPRQKKVNLVYSIKQESWNGQTNLTLYLKDLQY